MGALQHASGLGAAEVERCGGGLRQPWGGWAPRHHHERAGAGTHLQQFCLMTTWLETSSAFPSRCRCVIPHRPLSKRCSRHHRAETVSGSGCLTVAPRRAAPATISPVEQRHFLDLFAVPLANPRGIIIAGADGFFAGPEQLSAYLHWAPGQPDNSNHPHGECDAGMDSDGNNM